MTDRINKWLQLVFDKINKTETVEMTKFVGDYLVKAAINKYSLKIKVLDVSNGIPVELKGDKLEKFIEKNKVEIEGIYKG
jgi:hypothetical protein